MKKLTLVFVLIFVCLTGAFGQTPADSITMKKVFGGYQFYQKGKLLNMPGLVKTMQPNAQAFREIKAAQSNNTIATLFAGAGGFMIGWPLGTALGGGDPEWAMAAVGAGLAAISIPISSKTLKQARSAVNTYNNGLKNSSSSAGPEFRLGFVGNGIGVTMQF